MILSPSSESEGVLMLAKKVLALERDSSHFRAVQAQCTVAIEVYTGALLVVGAQNGIAAMSLGRTLFEAMVTAVILAKHPEKLDDFKNHGKLTTFQMARSIPSDSRFDSPKLKKFINDTQTEYDALQSYFKRTGNWHLLKNSDAFAEAELPENWRSRYSVRVSAIAHGDPFPIVQHSTRRAETIKSRRSMRNGKNGPRKNE
jgi:hypothetical protein